MNQLGVEEFHNMFPFHQQSSLRLRGLQVKVVRNHSSNQSFFHGLQNKSQELWGSQNQTRLKNKHQQHNKQIDSGASHETTQVMSNDVTSNKLYDVIDKP